MDRAIAEVNDPLGVTKSPASVHRAADMPCVGVGHGIAATQALGQCRIDDCAEPNSIAGPLELSVPILQRHPNLKLNVRVARGLCRSRNTAKCWQAFENVRRPERHGRAGRSKPSWRDSLSQIDSCIGQPEGL